MRRMGLYVAFLIFLALGQAGPGISCAGAPADPGGQYACPPVRDAEGTPAGTAAWGEYVPVIATAAVVLAGIVLAEHVKSLAIRRNGRASLREEMRQIMNMVRSKKPFIDPDSGLTYKYVNETMSTVAFDSTVSSGHILHLSPETQTSLNRLFFQVKTHNRQLEELDHFNQELKRLGPGFLDDTAISSIVQELHLADNRIFDKMIKVGDLDPGLRVG